MKTTSAGVLIVNDHNEALLGHVTYQSFWDILKGKVDEGETPLEAALREAYEESGLVLDPAHLVDLGLMPLNAKKNLHLFTMKVNKSDFLIDSLVCTSMVTLNGRVFPEIDEYKWVSLSELELYCAKSMYIALTGVLSSGKV